MAEENADAIAGLFGTPPDEAVEPDQSPFLGVPADYSVTRDEQVSYGMFAKRPWIPDSFTRQRSVTPLYRKGDEVAPASYGPERIAMLQQLLVNAGLIEKGKKYRIGVWDTTSKKAYQSVLEYANAAGVGWQEALELMRGEGDVVEGPERQPLTVQLSNPDDLKKIAKGVGVKVLGRRLNDDELAKFVAAYQAEERRAQQEAYDLAPTGGTVTAPADPSVMAEQQARKDNPVEAGVMDTINVGNEFFQLLRETD